MPTTYPEAQDQIKSLFWNAWSTGATAIAGYVPQVYWDGLPKLAQPATDAFYSVFSLKSVIETQANLQGSVDGLGSRRYNHKGLVFFKLFSPISLPTNVQLSTELCILVRDAYRGKSTTGGVHFYDVTIKDLGPVDDKFFVKAIIANYDFYEIG